MSCDEMVERVEVLTVSVARSMRNPEARDTDIFTLVKL